MDSQGVGACLEDCLAAAATQVEARRNYCSTRDALRAASAELSSLLQEAVEMKWPFVPEKWQYKETVSSQDKTNLTDLISRQLPQLMALLKAAILAGEAGEALAVLFLVDRFLYWSDESQRLLSITKLLHRRHPGAAVAPQLVIRQARVYLNSGKLQKAEFILSSLIINSGATGSWTYHSESDKLLVQAVSVQVRGLVLQKLGLWLEAAELIWASLIGYFALPKPDTKGIGTSLGVFANILVSMNDEDFEALKKNQDIDLSLLGDCSHRLLSAAEAAKLAVVYSQYASLYVLTNVVAQGTCLLSYSFSLACNAPNRRPFLLQAKQAFEVGLLTKTDQELVTSKQELHTFLKAAYSLAVVHKWLGLASETELGQATCACREALVHFYDYCRADIQKRDGLAADVMQRIGQVKSTLRVEPYPNSDRGSFIPDFYRKGAEERPVKFTAAGFFHLIARFQKYHESICESTAGAGCTKGHAGGGGGGGGEARLCITAIGTTVASLGTTDRPLHENCEKVSSDTPGRDPELQRNEALAPTPEGSMEGEEGLEGKEGLGSSWQNVSSVGSPPGSSGGYAGSCSVGHGAIDGKQATNNVGCCKPGPGLPRMHHTSSSSISGSEAYEMVEAMIDTVANEDDGPIKPLAAGGATRPMSRLSLSSSFGSLGGSFSSHSSWEKISPVHPPFRSCSRTSASGPTPFTPQLVGAKQSMEPLPLTETASSFEDWEGPASTPDQETSHPPSVRKSESNPACCNCQEPGTLVHPAPVKRYLLTEQDYRALLAGVCHDCLLERLQSKETKFQLKEHNKAYSGLHLKYSRATGLWTSRETCVYIGEPTGMKGRQRTALWVQFLHQEERLSSYMGKDYQEPKEMQVHLKDVERQMTSQYYVTQFNKKLYEKKITAQIFFLPSDVLLIVEAGEIVGCVTVEPYMEGDFVKLTNNTGKKDSRFLATEYGIAFGHFTYLFSDRQEVVVDLQGVVTANGKGLTYLTDPQIHSTRKPRDPSNFGERGLRYFLDEQHGPECNSVCKSLGLHQCDWREL
ncbi:unnamed protein product [Merluccius merluccius]